MTDLSKKEKKILELAIAGGQDSDMLILEQVNELEDKFDVTVEEIRRSMPDMGEIAKSMKGKDGLRGADGRDGDDGRDGETGPQGVAGRDGRDGTDGKNGLDGKSGKDGRDGRDGVDGRDGQDGAPDTPDQVVEKVNSSSLLIKKERIEGLVQAIQNSLANALSVGITTTNFFKSGSLVGRAKNINFTGSAVSSVSIVGDQANVSLSGGSGGGQVNSVVAGTGITVDSSDPANPIVTATGGTFTVMIPTGTVDGSNAVFVFASAPSVIVVDQTRVMVKTSIDLNANWTGTTTVTLQIAPNSDIFGY